MGPTGMAAPIPPPVVGDVNRDGVFDSNDFTSVFVAGKYADDIANNASFGERIGMATLISPPWTCYSSLSWAILSHVAVSG